VYPPSAADAHIEGVVILEVLIDEQGHVADTRVVRSVPQLDQAAMIAVKQWQYEPTLLNGAPVPIVMNVTVQFTLTQ
jgi:protein TonB